MDPNKEFSFTIKLDNTTIGGTFNGVTFTNGEGEATITLKGGESQTITDLPEGTGYTVTEADYSAAGYVTSSAGARGTISASAAATAAFTNTKNEVETEPETETETETEIETETETTVIAEASISVTKSLTYNGYALVAKNAVYYVALYEDEACTTRASEVLALSYTDSSSATVTFNGLEAGKTYYIAECDATGTALENSVGTLEDGTVFAADFDGSSIGTAVVEDADGVLEYNYIGESATNVGNIASRIRV